MTSQRPEGDWQPVIHSSRHFVTSDGQVWSDAKGRLLNRYISADGYWCVTIGDTPYKLHRLVAESFIGPQPPKHEVRHLNGNRLDCRLENLAWGTRSENNLDAVAHGTHIHTRKTECVNGHPFDLENTRWRDRGRGPDRLERVCVTCTRIRANARHARLRAERIAA